MENHSFSDPTPFPEGAIQPCWKVQVFRRGVDEPVACLEVHSGNFPPRKANKKNKVVWKLPDSLDETPRFGGIEKERLWDLWKQEKKNRRKSKKKDDGDEDEDDLDVSIPSATKLPENQSTIAPEKLSETSSPAPPPPPPGFGAINTKLEGRSETRTSTTAPLAVTPATGPPGLSMPRTNESSNPPPPPPPPGLMAQNSQASVGQSPASPSAPVQRPPQTVTPLPPPPPTAPPIPQPPISSFVFGSLRASEISVLPPATLSSVIGNQIAQILILSLTTPGQLPIWLARYHPDAQKLLLFGTAQALAHNAADRQQQWESLISASSPSNTTTTASTTTAPPALAAWDCQGWAVQTIPNQRASSSLPTPKNGHDNNNNDDLEPLLLVVLTGRTLQRQEILIYHLTLTLQSVGGDGPAQYQIRNEILSLARTV